MAERDVRGKKVGKYELLTPLSVGGMAELFLGTMRGPGGFEKYAVIKRILPTASFNESFVKMFLDEARITAAFSHPNIVQTFDIGEDPEGLWVALEFIAGANLNEVFNQCVKKQAVLSLGFSASVVHECALALHYAHTYRRPSGEEAPVIHRDVAQKNVMVSWDGQVKLLDFGIAKARGALSKTNAGTVKGTAGYMSPEQIRGEPLDGRSDVFSLGVVLWEMCTGERLFSAATELEEVQLVLKGEVKRPSEVEPAVPDELSEIILKALAFDPKNRFLTAKELARALSTRCGELLFEQEDRTAFMQALFAERIAEQRQLFDGQEHSGARLREAVKPLLEPEGAPSTVRRKVKTGTGNKGVRRKDKASGTARDPEEERLIMAAIELAAKTAEPQSRPRQWTGPLVLVVVVVIALGFVWKVLVEDRRPAASGLQRFPGEPVESEARTGTEAAVDNPLRPIVLKPVDKARAGTPQIPVVPDTRASGGGATGPSADAAPAKTGLGHVTLALLPSGTVSEHGREIAHGSLLTFSLSSGTHLLQVVGEDGVRRKLSLKVSRGKNKPLKLAVQDLPPE